MLVLTGGEEMVAFANFFNRLFSLFFTFSLMLTGGINGFFNGEIYPYKSENSVIGLETLTRSQGVTTDGKAFYFSGKNALEKVNLECDKILALNSNAIPNELKKKYNLKHIGGVSFANGYIYAPLEDSKSWQNPIIALYDAETLKYTGKYFKLPLNLHKRGAPWVAVNGEKGLAYTGDSRNYSEIYVFRLEDFSFVKVIRLSQDIEKIQGGEYYDGKLYFGTNDMTRAVYSVDAETGETKKLFDRIAYKYKYIENFGGEGEGLTVLPTPDGALIHTLQTGATFLDATLRHYAIDV